MGTWLPAVHTQRANTHRDTHTTHNVRRCRTNMTARMQAAGIQDPEGAALAQLVYRAKLEATVMTYNNLFLIMSMSFALVLLVVLMLDKPRQAAPAAAH